MRLAARGRAGAIAGEAGGRRRRAAPHRQARNADVRAAGSVPANGYRTTIRVVGDVEGRAAYRMERSNETVVAAGCLVAHPALVAMLDALVVPPGVEVTLRVSAATGEATALWDEQAGVVEGLPSHVATGPTASLTEVIAGHRLRVSAPSFFQSGPAAAELLIERVHRRRSRAGQCPARARCLCRCRACSQSRRHGRQS